MAMPKNTQACYFGPKVTPIGHLKIICIMRTLLIDYEYSSTLKTIEMPKCTQACYFGP